MFDFGIRQPHTGYRFAYRQHEANRCPGCGQSHWMIGRLSAECAFCGTALPLVASGSMGIGLIRSRGAKTHAPIAA